MEEEKDPTGTFTGNNIITWRTKNPWLKDIVDGDFFEVQRALQSDFSDAKQLMVVPMRVDSSGEYSLVDDSRDTWTGNAEIRTDTMSTNFSVGDSRFFVRDNEGNPLAQLSVTLSSNTVTMPSVPVYYRIRRSSASVWDWNDEFSSSLKIQKKNFLAPLANSQPEYTKDPEYDQNRKVHFQLKLNNANVLKLRQQGFDRHQRY